MLAPTSANSRDVAFQVLSEHHRTGALVAELLDTHCAESQLLSADRRLATEIAYGVVRRQATLDALIEPHVKRPRHRVEGELWTLLRMGTYQAVFVDSVPNHAAVHETVEVAKRHGQPRWVGFVNGVLRSVVGSFTNEWTDSPAADAIPIEPGRYRRYSRPVFGDPHAEPCRYLSRAFSFPNWLVERWLERMPLEDAIPQAFWFNAPAPMMLRVNLLKVNREQVLAALKAVDVEAQPGELPEAARLSRTVAVEQLPGFQNGWFSVQDESAMHAARLLAPQPGETVLDLCAAPGTKTMHVAELMQDQGRIVATDVNAERLAAVTQAAERLGIGIVEPSLIQSDGRGIPAGPFDAILVDVPCSNTGVLGKRPEVRWRIGPKDITELAALGRRLLAAACDRLQPGGRLVYSTCSLEPEENEQAVRAVLRKRPNLTLQVEQSHLPGKPGDGGYQALVCLVKAAPKPVD